MKNTNQNQEKIKVLICDDTAAYGVKIAAELSQRGIFAYTRKDEPEAILHSVIYDSPDIVVSDLTLHDTDVISVIQKVDAILTERPAFIVLSETDNSFIKRQVLKNGASDFLKKDSDISIIYDSINKIVSEQIRTRDCSLEIMVTDMIHKIGVPANVRGYTYLREAIISCVEYDSYVSVTKVIYPQVARKFKTNAQSVERNIRHAIEKAWIKGNIENIYSVFGRHADYINRPTNSEFIFEMADKIKLSRKKANLVH